MVAFKLEAWTAVAPSLESKSDWQNWVSGPSAMSDDKLNVNLKHIPMMLRRRFNPLGKAAMGAIGQLNLENLNIPCVFASQHGDTNLTLSLLEGIGRQEDMSPTGFSLAVHNAISGLYTIATKNESSVTAISAMQGHIASALFETLSQLQTAKRVLCVIYDTQLPELYRPYSQSTDFPYAIAIVFSREHGESLAFEYSPSLDSAANNTSYESELRAFISFLLNDSNLFSCRNNGAAWTLERQTDRVR
ncbi:hypothetical protein FX988_02323 [Paraglaciecola mesophila]|uniref:Beta-ketoacyl synthase-like N-terminal domain-containing protein n=1 Tax=Paraglaciecola mesophila TaxID=197222 RepID=A0A857JM73_9ALTE|nr:beta-ketoacyl synthase chain length factor [Paraglaciecola mesophila]QHJ12077.1 hypothetical protein FX988_02323 [Paraglaciecola mesophila]